MSDLKLGININVDTTDTQSKIQAIIESLSKLSESSNDAKFQEDVKNTVNQLTVLNTVLLASSTAAKQTGDSAGKAGEDIKKMASKATIDTLKDLQKTFSDMEKYIANFTKSFVDEAREMGKYEAKLKTFSGSAEEAAKNLKAVKDYAATAQPFTTKELTKAGVEIAKFGLDVKEVLPKISDFAAAIKEDVVTVSNDFGRALSGTKGGLMALATQYGLTKAKLIEYGAAVTQGGEIDKDALATKQAITRAMGEFAGSAADASVKYGASMAQLRNQTEEFRNEVGKELLPKLTELNNMILVTIKYFNSLAEPQKNSIANFLLFGTAIAGAGVAIAGAGIKVIEFKKAMDLANLSMTAAVPIVGVVAIAVGALANTYIDFWRKAEEAKSEKIVKDFEELAKAVNAVRDAFPKAGNAVSAFNEIVKQSVSSLANDAQGMEKLKTVTEGLTETQKQFSQKKLEDTQALTKAQSELQELEKQLKAFRGDDQLTKQTKEQLRLKKEEIAGIKEQIVQDKSSIETIKEKLGAIKDITKEVQKKQEMNFSIKAEGLSETINKIGESFKTAFKNVAKDDSWATDEIKSLNDMVEVGDKTLQQKKAQLESWLKNEKLTTEAIMTIRKELKRTTDDIEQAEKKATKTIEQENDKRVKAEEKAKQAREKAREDYRKGIDKQIDSIKALGDVQEISTQEEIARLQQVLNTERVTEEQRIEIVKRIQEVKKKAADEEKRIEEERVRANEQIEKQIRDIGKESYEISINNLKDQIKEYEKAGADKIKIEELYSKTVTELQKDVFEDFKQKEEQKRDEAEKTAEKIQELDKSIAENKKAQNDLLNEDTKKSNSPLMSMEEALSGGMEDPYQKKFKQLQKLKEEENKLEKQKNEELEKQKKIQEEQKKIQEDKQKAEEVFNAEIAKGTAQWQAQVDTVYSLTDAIRKATAEKEKYNSAGGGGSSENPQSNKGTSENTTTDNSNNSQFPRNDMNYNRTKTMRGDGEGLRGGSSSSSTSDRTTTMRGSGEGLRGGDIYNVTNYNTTVDNNAGSSGARTTRAVRDINSTAMKFGSTRRV